MVSERGEHQKFFKGIARGRKKKPSARESGRIKGAEASKKSGRKEDFGGQILKKKSTKKGQEDSTCWE